MLSYLITCIVLVFITLLTRKKTRHDRKIKTAAYILNRINGFSEAQKISYLRKVDAYAFEELILTCLERKGFPIQRSKSYSGDGGVDGRFFIYGEMHYIQAKRYSADIRYEHIEAFGKILKKHNCKGFFVHTGRTPPNIKKRNIDMTDITIVSGSRLIKLLDVEIKKTI
ncbi:restriction system protein [Rahnella inusitata]|nr:restriction system protein [Rahnella inusitata]